MGISLYGLIGQLILDKEKEKSHKEALLLRAKARLGRAEAGQTHSQELNQELEQLRSDVCMKTGDIHAVQEEIQRLEQTLNDFAGECVQLLAASIVQCMHTRMHARMRTMHAHTH